MMNYKFVDLRKCYNFLETLSISKFMRLVTVLGRNLRFLLSKIIWTVDLTLAL